MSYNRIRWRHFSNICVCVVHLGGIWLTADVIAARHIWYYDLYNQWNLKWELILIKENHNFEWFMRSLCIFKIIIYITFFYLSTLPNCPLSVLEKQRIEEERWYFIQSTRTCKIRGAVKNYNRAKFTVKLLLHFGLHNLNSTPSM